MAYLRPSSRLFYFPSLSLGLHVANLPIPPAPADRVQRGPAAAAASSITRRMSGRAAQASLGAPWPRTGPEGLCTRSWRQKSGTPPCHRPVLPYEVPRQRKPPPRPHRSGAREDAATRLPLRRAPATRSGRPLRGSCQPARGWCAPPSVAPAPPLRRAPLLLCLSHTRPPRSSRLPPPPP